jgi:hypothetical protein
MRVRYKKSKAEGYSSNFNMSSISEIIIHFPEGDATSEDPSELDVLLSDGNWHDMRESFRNHFLITDNYNTCFFEPPTEENMLRGYTL